MTRVRILNLIKANGGVMNVQFYCLVNILNQNIFSNNTAGKITFLIIRLWRCDYTCKIILLIYLILQCIQQ